MLEVLADWPTNFEQAKNNQKRLARKVSCTPFHHKVRVIAGIDAGVVNGGQSIRAVVTYHDAKTAELLDHKVAVEPCLFPYVPGFLSYRELPAVLKALAAHEQLPDMLMCDGQGLAHPRRFGIACHLGVLIDRPSIGVAKSRLVGDYQPPALQRGESSSLTLRGEPIGTVLCTRDKVKPLFISPGHKVSFKQSVEWTLRMGRGFKLPEPTRWADKLASNRKHQ